jgi:hypothetical protein
VSGGGGGGAASTRRLGRARRWWVCNLKAGIRAWEAGVLTTALRDEDGAIVVDWSPQATFNSRAKARDKQSRRANPMHPQR